ncbi:RNA-binding domain-containing protein [Parabacteroides johnsonii]|uniref:RNA-binding domain-containing protein n=1 Tax=Parabacteroides johnsonii TaxID=387661 RepID=UPI00265D4645|nr:RNA-binding domain-containing protein [Parabacteroides johnsonii]
MTLNELKEQIILTIRDLKDHGVFPKENHLYDYKKELNFFGINDALEIFMRNLAKDILSFSNGNGGIIILGIEENTATGKLNDTGLDSKNLDLLTKIDLNLITQKFEKITKTGVNIDLQSFQLGTRQFYYLLIEKQNQVLIPINDFNDYKIKKGEILYRASSKNEIANHSTQDFNRFLQIKSNEKNKEFMEIWSKLLPEIFDINPREILIINPKSNQIYGFNGKDNILSSSEIEIDHSEKGVFNVILNAISAGEIGKISDTEGKPLYKIVGEIKTTVPREYISLTTLLAEVVKLSGFRVSSVQLKILMKYLGWVNDENFEVKNPDKNPTNPEYNNFIWLERFDKLKNSFKVVCSEEAIPEIVAVLSDLSNHIKIFKKELLRVKVKASK